MLFFILAIGDAESVAKRKNFPNRPIGRARGFVLHLCLLQSLLK
jgi:hypothetical protein